MMLLQPQQWEGALGGRDDGSGSSSMRYRKFVACVDAALCCPSVRSVRPEKEDDLIDSKRELSCYSGVESVDNVVTFDLIRGLSLLMVGR